MRLSYIPLPFLVGGGVFIDNKVFLFDVVTKGMKSVNHKHKPCY